MPRTPTTTDTTVEWEERVTDPDSESLTLSLVLDAVDDGSGFTTDGTDSSNLSWLSFTKTANTLNDGTLENLVNIVADKSGLNQGYTYRFKITADDGTTAVDRTFTLSIEEPPPTGNFAVAGANNAETLYELGTEYDLSTRSQASTQPSVVTSSFFIKPDGNKFWTTSEGTGDVEEWSLGSSYDFSNENFVASFSIGFAEDIFWKPGGSRFWLIENSDGSIIEYSCTTAWDITSRTKETSKDLPTSYGTGVHWKPDGTQFFYSNQSDDTVYRYGVSTKWTIVDGITQEQTAGNTNLGVLMYGIALRNDGSELWIADGNNGIAYLTLSTSWDITTMNYQQHFSIGDKHIEFYGA
jgi:hypothetical protein